MSQNYPVDWDSRRKRVYRRDDYTCQNCGLEGGPRGNATLHAHHIVPKSKGGEDKLANLQTLCEECHNAVHNDVQAPTSEKRHSGKSSESQQKKISNPFEECPICDSNEISHHPSADETLQCTDCWSTLTKAKSNRLELRVGPRGHHRTVDSFSPEENGLTLLPENWKLLSKEDSLEEIDLEELQTDSDRWAQNHKKVNLLGVVVGILLIIGGVFTGSIKLFLAAITSIIVIQSTGRIYAKKRMIREELPTIDE
ncbi:HNH endonuclease [Halorussus gelatinilyticus]|uniref:HNH endonuclease n=1 Tax=Halorussus gelatinilyticus TaxID=2937524 RepID=A0A8U0IFE3_9EURY|nr:HNH endonuclease [Halorussus gelatinilyticus]UPV98778.1 HNH endonuclease [Halorussus gelatinilyticus]